MTSNFDSFAVPNQNNDVFNFDTPIMAEEREFVLLPEGEYPFQITDIEKRFYEPGPNSKLPPCPEVVATLTIDGGSLGSTKVKMRLFYHSSTQWRVSNLFVSVGLAKTGEQFTPNPDPLLGKTGRCHVKQRTYQKNDGTEGKVNDVDRCLPPAPVNNGFGGF